MSVLTPQPPEKTAVVPVTKPELVDLPSESHEERGKISSRIIEVLRSYSPPDKKGHQVFRPLFEQTVRDAVRHNKAIHMVLPAFPFKSPNNKDKVLGTLPDLGEETALARLEGLCATIDEFYPGTKLTIVSDGLVYNDLMGVPESDVYDYGTEIRRIASETCPHISFARISKLISEGCKEAATLQEYQESASWYREQFVAKYLPEDFDVDKELKDNINALMTYRGYIKFLKTDLRHEPSRQGLSNKKFKKMNEATAKLMIRRGVAFSNAVKAAFPSEVRISIHASESVYKMPICVLPGIGTYTTPWHASPVLEVDGSLRYVHSETVRDDSEYELVYRNDRPSHYRRKSHLYEWERVKINVVPIYPCGLMISPNGPATMRDLDMKKLRILAELASPIVLRGFSQTKDLELFKDKAREMGSVMPWKFGEVLVVKDAAGNAAGLNNVLCSEPMPFHFDGLFKTKKVMKNGVERLLPQAPRFQFFTVVTPSEGTSGQTLVASSRLLFSMLPESVTVEQLEGLTWSVRTPAFDNSKMEGLELVIKHPTLGTPCLRYHEPWLSDKTIFDPTIVHIEGGNDHLMEDLDRLLYDRRVCYYHSWAEGDLIISDNINMMHTRSGFQPKAPRELWRIHVD